MIKNQICIMLIRSCFLQIVSQVGALSHTAILSLYVQRVGAARFNCMVENFIQCAGVHVLKLASAAATCCYNVESVGIDVCPRACADRHDLKQEVNECNNSKMSVFQKWWRQSCGKNIYEKKSYSAHTVHTLKESAILKMTIVGAHIIEKRQGSTTHALHAELHTFCLYVLKIFIELLLTTVIVPRRKQCSFNIFVVITRIDSIQFSASPKRKTCRGYIIFESLNSHRRSLGRSEDCQCDVCVFVKLAPNT